MRSWPSLVFDSATVLTPNYLASSSENGQAHGPTHGKTTAVVNETAINSHAFIYDSVIGVGLLVLVWVFLAWTYPSVEKSQRKRNLLRIKSP